MTSNAKRSADLNKSVKQDVATRPGALLISGVVGVTILFSCSLFQALNGEQVLLSTYFGVALLLLCLLTATVGFAQIIDWADLFPASDPNRPEVKTFDDEEEVAELKVRRSGSLQQTRSPPQSNYGLEVFVAEAAGRSSVVKLN